MSNTLVFEALHARTPGRLRYRVPVLRRNRDLATALERALTRVRGIAGVRANPVTGTLLVLFLPKLPRHVWEATMVEVLDAAAPRAPEPSGDERASAALAKLNHAIVGFIQAIRHEHVLEEGRPPSGAAALPAVPFASRAWNASRRIVARVRTTSAKPPPALPAPQMPTWHLLELSRILDEVGAHDPGGVSPLLAAQRLASDGPNALPPVPRRSELRIFLDQFGSVPVAMLGASAVLSVATGGVADALAIVVVLGINAVIGYLTESGAERTIESLTHAVQPAVPLLRAGSQCEVPVEQIVRGDVLVLRAGVFVAADARILSVQDLTVDESSLTGESGPVVKTSEPLHGGVIPLAERLNMVFRGTLVTGGSAQAVVVATGVSTEIGRIQALASSVEAPLTPMQRQLDRLARQLAIGAGVACGATLGMGLLRGQALLPMFRTAISLGVAAVPEGLPTVAIITLARGLARMRQEHVIVRQLSAVEALGAVQVVCLDKTGTITLNRMTVVAAHVGLESFAVKHAVFVKTSAEAASPAAVDLHALLRIAVLCNEVELEVEAAGGLAVLLGSPTESALIELARAVGVDVPAMRARHPLLSTLRRAESRNYMSTLHAATGGAGLLAVKGRPSDVLALSSACLCNGEITPLDAARRARIELENERLAARALRVLGFAYREQTNRTDQFPAELVWVGLIGMEDPPREGVADVMARFHAAGVRTVMITGDQSATAQAVGRQIGLAMHREELEVVDSTQLESLEPNALQTLARTADVFARVSPAHKLHIVKALQDAGTVVAMTGDGVNDGPALKVADIGIAMGAVGSSPACEMADVILEDDELRTLIVAIEQGRTIYENIRKAVHFIIATNLTEILYTFTCVATGLGEPLTPMQLLWINLATDVFPELALASQPPEADVLARSPRDPARPMFTREDMLRIGAEGVVMTAGTLAAYLITARRVGRGPLAGSVGFTTLTLAQLLHAVSARSETHTIFDRARLTHNRWLTLALGGTALAQLAVSLVPGARRLLGTVPLGVAEWGTAITAALGPFLVNEALKPVYSAMSTTVATNATLTARPA